MKIIIAGGRNYVPQRKHRIEIIKIITSNKVREIVSGGCITGADVFGECFAFFIGNPIKYFFADWNRHGKAAGPIRNEQMAKYADGCILLPGGKGTANMKMNAVKYGLKVWEIK